MKLRLIALFVSAVSLLAGIGVINTPAVAAGCRGWVRPSATVGGNANTTQGSMIAYWTGAATAGRSPCYLGTQRIVLTHQAYKYDPTYGWVTWARSTAVAFVRPGYYGILNSKQEFAPLNMTATTTVRWYTDGGRFLAKRQYKMNGSSWYSCPNAPTCVVQYDSSIGSYYIHWLHGNGGRRKAP